MKERKRQRERKERCSRDCVRQTHRLVTHSSLSCCPCDWQPSLSALQPHTQVHDSCVLSHLCSPLGLCWPAQCLKSQWDGGGRPEASEIEPARCNQLSSLIYFIEFELFWQNLLLHFFLHSRRHLNFTLHLSQSYFYHIFPGHEDAYHPLLFWQGDS